MFNAWRQIFGLLLCFWLAWGNSGAIALPLPQPTEDFPVVEYLRYAVPPADQTLFIEKEAEIWGQFNASFPGFNGKEIWQDPQHPNRLVVVVHWQSRAQMQAIPKAQIKLTDDQFTKAVGQTYQLLDIQEFRELTAK
ncbi:MAG: TIGR03792 family protein [Limnothrix sp.]